jgi:hypothetical protein
MWSDRLDNLDDHIGVAMSELDGNPDTLANSTSTIAHAVAPVAGDATATIPSAREAGSSPERIDEAQNSSPDGAEWQKFEDGEIGEMVDLITRDPEALMEKFGSIPSDQRPLVLAAIQQKLQEINQMSTMMSNFQKSMHDTQKAVLNNFRV